MKRVILCLALCFLGPPSFASGVESDSRVFASRLTALLKAGSLDPDEAQIKNVNESRQAFLQFADDYPRSIYADDSRFIYSLIEFMGAVLVPPRDMDGAKQMIVMMYQMVRKYPDGRLEPDTYSILRRELGDQAVGGSFDIPYRCIVEYMQALMASQTRDYKSAVLRYNRIKQALQPITDEAIAIEIYVPLYISYMRSARSKDAQAVLDEVSAAYPGSGLESILRSVDAGEKK